MFKELRAKLSEHSWFNDKRLSNRMGIIVEQVGNNIGSSLPQSAGNPGQTQALYHFLKNDKVTERSLYQGCSSIAKEELSELSGNTYLGISDTTDLNYTTSKTRFVLGCLKTANQKGEYCQSLVLADAQGCHEKLLHQKFYSHDAETMGKSREVISTEQSKLPIEAKESYRWLEDLAELGKLFGTMTQHRFIHIIDSEGDIFELFAARRYAHIHILTRSHHDRKLVIDSEKDDNQAKNLRKAVQITEVRGCILLPVKDHETGEKRQAELEVRYVSMTMDVPQGLKSYQKDKGYEPISIQVVEVREITPSSCCEKPFKPLHWFLMTTLPVETFVQAIEVIDFYVLRWRIEDFHLVVKEGFKVERLQFKTQQALRNAITIYSIAAIQLLKLRYLSETQADEPMEIIGLPVEAYQATAQFIKTAKKININIVEQPTVAQFYHLITLLGTGNPKNTGIRALWAGLKDFNIIWEAFKAFKAFNTS
jgi:hypothetical protein